MSIRGPVTARQQQPAQLESFISDVEHAIATEHDSFRIVAAVQALLSRYLATPLFSLQSFASPGQISINHIWWPWRQVVPSPSCRWSGCRVKLHQFTIKSVGASWGYLKALSASSASACAKTKAEIVG